MQLLHPNKFLYFQMDFEHNDKRLIFNEKVNQPLKLQWNFRRKNRSDPQNLSLIAWYRSRSKTTGSKSLKCYSHVSKVSCAWGSRSTKNFLSLSSYKVQYAEWCLCISKELKVLISTCNWSDHLENIGYISILGYLFLLWKVPL